MGWKQEGGPATRRSLPPVEFHTTEPVVQEIVEEVDQESLGNLPIGLDNNVYRWTDLHGEGIPGVLTEREGAQIWAISVDDIHATANRLAEEGQ